MLPMPSPFDPELASKLLNKAGVMMLIAGRLQRRVKKGLAWGDGA